jgi:hypothetical protein
MYHLLKKEELFVNVFAGVTWTPTCRDAPATYAGQLYVAHFTKINIG